MCINDFNQIYSSVVVFSIVCVNMLLTCLSVVQFLIIKGKMKPMGWKFVAPLVTVSIFYSLLWAIATYLYNKFQQVQFICAQLCQGAPVAVASLTYRNIFGISILVVVVLPCINTIFLTLMWSCCIFKKRYIGDDNQLTRRIISLPVIMPAATIFASVFYFILHDAIQSELLR